MQNVVIQKIARDFAADVCQSLQSGDFLRISNKALWTELSPVALPDSPPFPTSLCKKYTVYTYIYSV
jgi:hypothetical protein